ncbi:hypothetical protein ACFE04_028178 [Oxalis oulophora]
MVAESPNKLAENNFADATDNLEAGRISFSTRKSKSTGVVYGDIGTSPLYVLQSTFPNGINDKDDLLGVFSLIMYTLIFVPLIKYVFIVLYANDNGDGGTFALYSLISKHAKVSFIPNEQPEDKELSNYMLAKPSNQSKGASRIKEVLEKSMVFRIMLFLFTILGTSMVIGDGILTPSISVLSAVGGIRSLGHETVIGVSVAILILLFCVQRFGTDKVGYAFAPIICIWLALITGIGLYNICTYGWGIFRAFNPVYIIKYFQRNGKQGWISLGGIVLCITGTEAMFADLGHFNVRAIQISFSTIVFPALLVTYAGQAAYLRRFPDDVSDTFYKSVPEPIYWPTFVVAVFAAIIASQALISGAFAIIAQSLSLGCFPKVKVVHTSAKFEGQVYIPEINYWLMISCVLVTVGFQTTVHIGNAYGIAVVAVMIITTCMLTLIMLVVWKTSIWLIAIFFLVFFSIEGVFFSAVSYKFVEGGYLPLLFALKLMTVMGIWHYVHKEKYLYELKNKVSSEYIRELVSKPEIKRVPGIGLLYSELVQGIPPIFSHFIANFPAIHSIIVFVTIKPILASKVALEERFSFHQLEPKEHRIFRCVVRLGYNDQIGGPHEFEQQLVLKLKGFIRESYLVTASIEMEMEEIEFVQKQMKTGVVYLLGQADVVAKPNSSLLKKAVVNYGYAFLSNNCRHTEKMINIPHTKMIKVGMTYQI